MKPEKGAGGEKEINYPRVGDCAGLKPFLMGKKGSLRKKGKERAKKS